ncbi:MAG: hypothetical protein OEU91_04475 [Gammaproteobacteria bacterium]|nr:hypothetical protein [Gammaproteobacteria bacterium]
MSRKTTGAHKYTQSEDTVHPPTILALVVHILTALISDGMAWVIVPTVAVIAYLYNNHIQNDALLAITFIGLAVIALVRGCLNWQKELNEYQHQMALERHKEQAHINNNAPDYFPLRRRY